MKPLRIMSVVGARPNFMKIAPFMRAIAAHNVRAATTGERLVEPLLVHTGQHYDANMSDTFFRSLGIPKPDVDLGIGSGTHAEQVGRTMIAFEPVVRDWHPDWVVVVGDVNATCACSITAKKEHVKLAHIEAGLRSFDMRMPEEINRIVTDRLSDLLFTPDALADENLRNECAPEKAIHRVGNIMIDTLEANRDEAAALDVQAILLSRRITLNGSDPAALPRLDSGFAVMTLHRPSNVDHKPVLSNLVRFFTEELAPQIPLVWSVHPRTRERLREFGLWDQVTRAPSVVLLDPVGYHEMLKLNMEASLMLTDSGGLQEECCVLGTPCITLRENTERPITLVEHDGASRLAGHDIEAIRSVLADFRPGMESGEKRCSRPDLWDGHTAERIVQVFTSLQESA